VPRDVEDLEVVAHLPRATRELPSVDTRHANVGDQQRQARFALDLLKALGAVWRADDVIAGFPGGVLELGETVAQGAMRELREETGVVAETAGPLTVIDTIDRDQEGRVRYHYTLVAVIGDWRSGEGVPGDDADEVAWLTRSEIVNGRLLTAPALLPLLDLAASRRR
jgi:ADP-ribose pyrophosphatase YjhB (NUDIX family)